MKCRLALSAALLVLLLVPPLLADEEEAVTAEALVQRLLATPELEGRLAFAEEVVVLAPDPADVAAWLKAGRSYAADAPTGWLELTNACTDGVERNYLLHVPADYTPEKSYRLVVDLHGGVSRPQMLSHDELGQMKFFWGEHAEANGYLLALPAGQKDAEWWTAVGAQHVLDVIGATKRTYNVDENRVFATGFSDGASGSFYLALTHPTLFAGFIPLNGHLAVTQARGLQVHLGNLKNRPLYVVNTENDSLYPSASVGPIIAALAPLGVDVTWHTIPGFTHNPMYMGTERPVIANWIDKTVRDPQRKTIVWQGTKDAPHRVDWLDGVEVVATDGDEGVRDPNPALPPGRVLIGVNIEQAFAGPGVKVSAVSEDTPAETMGVKPGDVIVGLDDAEIGGFRDLRGALGRKSPGDDFELHVLREDERLSFQGSFTPAEPRPVFRRGAPWGTVSAAVDGNVFDVRTHGVKSFDLYLSGDLVDLSAAVKVQVGGELVHDAVVEPDLGFMLAQAARDEDRQTIYSARLHIEVPTPEATEAD